MVETTKVVRKTTTIPKEHSDYYDAEVLRHRKLGIRTTVSQLIREAIAADVIRRKRKRQ